MQTINDPAKHTLDVLAFLAGMAAWLKVFTDILGFFVALAGVIWWGIRFYEWYKGKKYVNERQL